MNQPSQPDVQVAVEFPRHLLALLRCSRDGGKLATEGPAKTGAYGIIDARLRCLCCPAEYTIENGIARMLDGTLTPEDEHEIAIRDVEFAFAEPAPFVPPAKGWRSVLSDLIEIPPFLSALEPLDGRRVLEIGCGDGRFTMLMAQRGADVLAIDFSINALRKLAMWLPGGVAPTTYPQAGRPSPLDLRRRIGLVQADASRGLAAPQSFDRALSTTPLDSREQRLAMYRMIADALTDDGWFIGSVEHDDLIRRGLGQPLARRYEAGGIFIEHFAPATVRRECAPYFGKVRSRPIRPRVPLVTRLPLALAVRVSRVVAAMPGLRQLGEILLFRAEAPLRLPAEDAYRPGNRLVKFLFRLKTRAKPTTVSRQA
ncbi:MAG TPA: class I SAM-dependent methyltransferase [Aliidongia sp.]|nr:class I SAM-dependent methyltransferase [Aliidongia sp.]